MTFAESIESLKDATALSRGTERRMAAAGLAIVTTGVALVAYVDPTKVHFLPVCPLLALTGFACPGCGLTRAFHSLFHGDIISALDFNLLMPIWAAIFGWVFVSLFLTTIGKKALPMWPTNPKFMSVYLVILVVFGIVRNIPVYPLTILYP